MFVTVSSREGWIAEILLSDLPTSEYQDWVHLQAQTIGGSEKLALEAADWVLQYFGNGRTCMIRAKPEATTYVDFDTKITHYRGYVRFSWENVPYHHYDMTKGNTNLPVEPDETAIRS